MVIPHQIQIVAALGAPLIYTAIIWLYLTCGFKEASLRKIHTSPFRNSTHPHRFSVLSQDEMILKAETLKRFSHKILQWQILDLVAQDCNPNAQKVESEDWEFKDSLGDSGFSRGGISSAIQDSASPGTCCCG